MKSKTITYPQTIKFTDNGKEQSLITQLYEIGVYGIWNNNSRLQGGYEPNQLQSLKKKLIKAQKDGKITNLEFGRDITIEVIDGFNKEIREE